MIDMQGHVDATFTSADVTVMRKGGSYINGIWHPTEEFIGEHIANIQPLNNREIVSLAIGAERLKDVRKVYINEEVETLTYEDDFLFLDQKWKAIAIDNRPWHNYCKIIVERYDVQA